MCSRLIVAVLLMLSLAVPAWAQPDKPSFSLNSSQTYGPGEKAEISVWAHNVEALEFRLYRVNDPVKFFAFFKDQHSFGGIGPRVGHEHTLLEKFHAWKHRVWAWVRDFFRGQFSVESRSKIREWREKRAVARVSKVEHYAQVPFLNRQQLVAAWSWTAAPGKQPWGSQTVGIPVKDAGVYLVEATAGGLRAYTIVIVTDIAVITKTARGQVLSYVIERKSGKPVANADVLLWVDREQVANSRTDANGIVLQQAKVERPDSVTVLVVDGKRFAANALNSWTLGSGEESRIHAYGYTERPIYRPGDRMHFKFLLRARTPVGYQVPSEHTFHMELRDAQGNNKLTQEAASNSNGTLHGDYNIPADAALGEWSIELKAGERYLGSVNFGVEEYKKPEYQVRVTPVTTRVIQGQPIKATIEARYYFGEPVAHAKVAWVVHKSLWWAPGRYAADRDDDTVADEGEDQEDGSYSGYGGEQTEEHKGTLDADGKLTITLSTSPDKHRNDLRYRIEARVTDEGNREISGAGFAFGTYGSFFVSAQPDSYIYQPGAEAKIQISARDYSSHAVQTEFRAELIPFDTKTRQFTQSLATSSGRTDATGNAQISFRIPQAGQFRVRVSAQTPEHREVEDFAYLWAAGSTPWWAQGQQRGILKIITDKKEYKPGESARVIVTAPEGASHVLVTVEGDYLYHYQVARTNGGTVLLDIPIKPEYAPNAWIHASYIQDGKLYSGRKKLKVPATSAALNVELQPSQPQFEPGSPAIYRLTARDASGRPVRGEFSIGVVDEAIYDLRQEYGPNIVAAFYGEVYDTVGTSTSLQYYFFGTAGKRAMELAQLRPRHALAQLKPERLVQPKVRKAFPDTAFWNAEVETNDRGEAQVKFEFPDSLTTWRTTARGITADSKVGAAISKVVVRKNLLVRLVVPRFFRQGDEVTVSTIVHNYLPADKTARLSMEFDGLQVLEGETRDVPVARGADAKLYWRVKVLNVSKARVLGKALTDQESDAMELTLPVEPFGVKLADARTGSITAGGEQKVDLVFPASSQSESRSLEIDVAPSVAGTIFSALDYLTTYPYGCTEQTMSSFLPNVIVAQATKQLNIKSDIRPDKLERKVNAGLERLYSYQHEDGAWGWWKTDDDSVFMTAYVVQGLGQAQAAGYNIRYDVLAKSRKWLVTAMKGDRKLYPDLKAYAAYAIAVSGEGDKEVAELAWQRRDGLSPFGTAVLGLALRKMGDGRSGELAAHLESGVKQNDSQAWWPSDHDWLLDFTSDTTVESTALALKLLTAERPQSPLLVKAAQFLVTHRNQGFWWDSTKQTAMVVFGLTDFMKQSGELAGDFTAEVYVNNRQVLSKHFVPANATEPAVVVRLAASDLGGGNSVRVVQRGAGSLYWSVRQQYYSTDSRVTNSGSFQLSIVREYFRLISMQKNGRIVYHLDPMPDILNVGDVIAVRLTVGGGDWRYLMVEDPILSGAESIPRDDLYELDQQPSWWGRWFTDRELHDNQTDFFQTWFFHGQREYVYLLKIVNPGRFRISPARVEPMYQPQYFSTTEAKTVTVK